MNSSARGPEGVRCNTVKRFELTNGLDTVLYKNTPLIILSMFFSEPDCRIRQDPSYSEEDAGRVRLPTPHTSDHSGSSESREGRQYTKTLITHYLYYSVRL